MSAAVFSSSSSFALSVFRIVIVCGTNGADLEESFGGTNGGADDSSFVAVDVAVVFAAVFAGFFDVASTDVFFFPSALMLFFLLLLLLSVLARDLPKELSANTEPSTFFLVAMLPVSVASDFLLQLSTLSLT